MDTKPRILIAYDGSETADAALDDLTHAGFPPDAEVQILSIAEWFSPAPASSHEVVTQERVPESGCVAATLIDGDCFWQPLGANRFAQERLGRVPLARRSQQKIDGVAFFVVA